MKIGIIGGGQLGRMLALAGYRLGFQFAGLEPSKNSPLSQVSPCIAARYDDPEGLAALHAASEVITYEFENVPEATLRILEELGSLVLPGGAALLAGQDRVDEKDLFRRLGIPTAKSAAVSSGSSAAASLRAAVEDVGPQGILKTRRLGYDGKGQVRVAGELSPNVIQLAESAPCIFEELIRFNRELSIVGVRDRQGDCRFYPLVQNTHSDGILVKTVAPAPNVSTALQDQAERYLKSLMEHLDYVGVLALELFERDGELLANEFAPRVHNTGHWSMDGAETDQFENHIRAISGLPLGSTALRLPTVMLNLLGTVPPTEALLGRTNLHLHLYGKEPRPGRKLGHLNICGEKAVETVEELGRSCPELGPTQK